MGKDRGCGGQDTKKALRQEQSPAEEGGSLLGACHSGAVWGSKS